LIGVGPRRSIAQGFPEHAEMAAIDSRQLILEYLAACYDGELDRAATFYDDDIDFICYAPVELFPTLGAKRGKPEMIFSLTGLRDRFSVVEHTVDFIAAEGDRVAVKLVLRLRDTGNDRIIRFEIGNFFTLRNGRIVTYRQFLDSFDVVQQVLGRDLVSAILKSAP
jgi:ketosteroid isomerase-like protein